MVTPGVHLQVRLPGFRSARVGRACTVTLMGLLAGAGMARAQDSGTSPDATTVRTGAQSPPGNGGTGAAEAAPLTPADILASDTASESALRTAAVSLCAQGGASANLHLRNALARGTRDPRARAVLSALAAAPAADESFLVPLQGLLGAGDAEQRPLVLAAIASLRTREAAGVLLDCAAGAATAAERDAALSALVRLSGREDLGRDLAGWTAWLDQARAGDAIAWHVALCTNLAAAADRARSVNAALTDRLVVALRRLHLATAVEQRPELLTGLLRDPIDAVVLLGLELVARELSAGTQPDDAIRTATVALLGHPRAAVRESAALLVATIGTGAADTAVATALAKEDAPSVAAALLNAAQRWPGPLVEDAVVRWLTAAVTPAPGTDPAPRATRDAAIDTGWALYRAGLLRRDQLKPRVLELLRMIRLTDLTPGGIQLRAALGDRSDAEALAALLGSAESAQRLATAEALLALPDFLPRILAAARLDPQLVDLAVRGVITLDPSVEGFRAMLGVTAHNTDQRRPVLVTVASVLPSEDVRAAAALLDGDPQLQEAVLAQLARAERIMSERASPSRLRELAEGLLDLARLRLGLGRAADALAALDALPELTDLTSSGAVRDLRAAALLLLNRSDAAQELSPSLEAWLMALEVCPHDGPGEMLYSGARALMTDATDARARGRLAAAVSRLGLTPVPIEPVPLAAVEATPAEASESAPR